MSTSNNTGSGTDDSVVSRSVGRILARRAAAPSSPQMASPQMADNGNGAESDAPAAAPSSPQELGIELAAAVLGATPAAEMRKFQEKELIRHLAAALPGVLTRHDVAPAIPEQREIIAAAYGVLVSRIRPRPSAVPPSGAAAPPSGAAAPPSGAAAVPSGAAAPAPVTAAPSSGGAAPSPAATAVAAREAPLAASSSGPTSMRPEAGSERGFAAIDERLRETVERARAIVQPMVLTRIDISAAATMTRNQLAEQLSPILDGIRREAGVQLSFSEQRHLLTVLLDDMLGLGPLEPLLADDNVADIMVNGPDKVYAERRGRLELTNVKFRDGAHLMSICQRIVSRMGRRIDESTPICDTRLFDGSRINIIGPPLTIDGTCISIRKFSRHEFTLSTMSRQNNLSEQMATFLRIAARCRLNILISGGTGSGKTTLLNALSQMIDTSERVITIEDAAELQLQQPHVVRLETRPPNLEGEGEINMRDLVKNALRMRPDRIILGEVRGSEALDMLQAMNTGHDGSMCTIHANRPREALTRLENLFGMAGLTLPPRAVRTQIANSINLVIQIRRMRDGNRRITSITEVIGMEGDIITTQEMFSYEFAGEAPDGTLIGEFVSSGLRSNFLPKAEYYGLGEALTAATA